MDRIDSASLPLASASLPLGSAALVLGPVSLSACVSPRRISAGQLAARASSASAALAAAAGPEFYTLARLGRRAPAPTPCCAEAALG